MKTKVKITARDKRYIRAKRAHLVIPIIKMQRMRYFKRSCFDIEKRFVRAVIRCLCQKRDELYGGRHMPVTVVHCKKVQYVEGLIRIISTQGYLCCFMSRTWICRNRQVCIFLICTLSVWNWIRAFKPAGENTASLISTPVSKLLEKKFKHWIFKKDRIHFSQER